MAKYPIVLSLLLLAFTCNKNADNDVNPSITPTAEGMPVLTDSAMISLDFIDSMSVAVNLYWIQNDGGNTITSRGLVWSVSPNPTLSQSDKKDCGSDVGGMSTTVTGLLSNTVYYIREYATNSAGTSYCDQRIFKTAIQFKDAAIGTIYGGGMIFYFLQPGDPTYDPAARHGFTVNVSSVAAPGSFVWNSNSWKTDVSGTNEGVTFGYSNTANIASEQGGYCAATAGTYVEGAYTGWCIPSKDELNYIYNNVGPGASGTNKNIGKFPPLVFWTSTQYDIDQADFQDFSDGSQGQSDKSLAHAVLQIREF